MPAVKSVILVIIIAGKFPTETQFQSLKHDAACAFQCEGAMESTTGQAATAW